MKPSSGTHISFSLVFVLALASLACATEAHREPAAAPEPLAASSAGTAAETTTPVYPMPSASALANATTGGAPSQVAPPADAQPVEKSQPPQQDPRAASPPTAATATPESPALATLRRYYADLNAHRFEANRYFAQAVKNYITMRKPTANAIDHYLRDVFPKQFESYEFLLDETTLREEPPNVFTFLERSRYYLVKSHEFRENLAQVRVEFDADGKIVDFRHTKVLTREKTPELRE
jgi:hypothetical protein